jgi:hypothetical protein
MEFDVPRHVVRIDIIGVKTTHGWQVRYGKPWKFFSDRSANGTGAQQALANATDELNHRIATLPAPTRIKEQIASNKSSTLPSGISGPFQRLRKGRKTAIHYFQVTLPIHGGKAKNVHIYIGSEKTVTDERIQLAMLKSIALRKEYIAIFQQSATQSKREKTLATLAG